MQFVSEHYFRAALERIEDAHVLYAAERFTLCMYSSGVAVECLLRAFCWRNNPVLDARHDLLRLFKESGIVDAEDALLTRRGVEMLARQDARAQFLGARDVMVRLWSNDYRFAPESQVRSRLRQLGLTHTKRGNQVKPSALALYNAAKLIVDKGTVLWTSAKK